MLKLRNAFLAVISLAIFACQEPIDREIEEALKGSTTRLAAAIEQREFAKTDLREFQALDAATELFDRLARENRSTKGETPSGPSSGPGGPGAPSSGTGGISTEREPPGQGRPAREEAKPRLESQAPDELLADLLRLREELALRGSVDSHRASAEAAWEFETLQQLSRKLTFPPDFPPANEFRLLAPETLDKLIERWTDKQRHLERFAAAVPFSNSRPALEECSAKLQALREARVAPQVQAPLFPRPRDSLGDTKAWIAQRTAGRSEAIQRAEVQYLERTLAAVPDDVAAAMRLTELKTETGRVPAEATHLAWRRKARDLAYALSPRPAPPTSQAEDLLRNLISDPLTAAQNEAVLDLAWSKLRTIEPPSQLDTLLPRRLRNDREAWIISLLGDRELLHADALLSEALSRLHIVSAQWPALLRSSNLPQERIERYAESVKREIAFRKSRGVSPAVTATPQRLALPASIERLATAQVSEILTSPEGKRREWEALQRFAAAGVSGSEFERRLAFLTLIGLQDQVGHFEREASRFRRFRSEITQNGLPLLPLEAASALADAREALWSKGRRIRRGLDQLNGHSVEEIAGLKRRMDDAILLCGFRWGGDNQPPAAGGPPRRSPPGGGPAAAYADPALLAATQSFEKSMQRLESLTPIPERPANGRPTYAFEKDHGLRVRLAASGRRPEAKGWRVGETAVSYDQIDKLRTIQGLPGGVALGRRAEVIGDFHKYGLVYDAADRRLKLVSLEEILVLPEVAPAVLKACFLFARDKDPVAVSIGYTGSDDKLFGRNARRVSIHPALRDTQVGLDVIEADRLPWSLEDETLPNGRKNPFVAQMGPAIEQVRKQTRAALPVKRLLDEVRGRGYSLDPASRASWISAILELSATNSAYDLMIRAVVRAEKPEDRFGQYSTLEDREILKQIDELLNDARSDLNDPESVYRDLQRGRDSKDPLQRWKERYGRQEPTDVFGPEEDGRDPYDIITGKRAPRLPFEDRTERTRKRYELLEKHRTLPETIERRQKVREALNSLPATKEGALFSLCFASFAQQENPSWNEAVRLTLALASSADSKAEEIAEQTLLLVQAKQLSLLTDAKMRWERASGGLRDESALRVRYVRGEVRASDQGLSRPDVAAEHPAAGQAATGLLPRLEAIYPALAQTRTAAAWIALMRWALEPGNVAWLDLADLATTDHRTVPTPDYFCDNKRGQPCLEEIGNTAP